MNRIAHFINPSFPTNKTQAGPIVAAMRSTEAQAAAGIKSPDKPSLISKISSAASIGFKALAATALYWVNPSLFAIGFFAGIIYDKQSEKAIGKIEKIWLNQPWIGTAFIGFACALSLPVSLAAGALMMSAHLGSSLSTAVDVTPEDEKRRRLPSHAIG